MSADKPTSLQGDVISKLDFLRAELRDLEADKDFQAIYLEIPTKSRNDRSFSQIVYQDLFHAYFYACHGIKPAHIDQEVFRLLLTEEKNKSVTLKDAHKYINREFYRYEQHEPFGHTPEFLTLFNCDDDDISFISISMIEVKRCWDDLAYALAEASVHDSVIGRMEEYINHTKEALRRFEDLEPPAAQQSEPMKFPEISTDIVLPATPEKVERFKTPAINNLYKKALAAGIPPHVMTEMEGELATLDAMPTTSQDYSSRLQPLITLVKLPWNKTAPEQSNINEAHARMHEKHAGLDTVKNIITQHIAVQMRTGKPSGTILCLDGAPGVGKTSLAQTIAYAMGRPLVRIALGGMHDTAEMRGHRSTYVGAKAGRIIAGLIQAGVKNPVILLDEIDKIDQSRGNLEATLLEILDPEQNAHFKDAFINAPFDLSEVVFIATSNDKSRILPPLRDRMEIIDLPHYTSAQKYEIAQNHLLPKNLKAYGLVGNDFSIAPAALKRIISDYVNEPGVRKLERHLKSILRHAVYKLESGSQDRVHVTEDDLVTLLKKPITHKETLTQEDAVGVANGLYVAGSSGGLMAFEVIKIPSPGKTLAVTGTGLMKDSMKESLSIVSSWLRAQGDTPLLKDAHINDFELHIDAVMDGPKDGPSAGIAITAACVSTLTDRPLRHDLAMTGKMTLGGRVRAVGGILQKLEGAMKNGMKIVLIPQDNESDLAEVSAEIKNKLTIIPVAHINDVLSHVFAQKASSPTAHDDENTRVGMPPLPTLPLLPPPRMS